MKYFSEEKEVKEDEDFTILKIEGAPRISLKTLMKGILTLMTVQCRVFLHEDCLFSSFLNLKK